jgi:predicted nucleic acid-binding Zn ribbon protein
VTEPVRHCPYCGVPLRENRLVCVAHADLPNLDPQLRRPKVQPAPFGVQPFTKELS